MFLSDGESDRHEHLRAETILHHPSLNSLVADSVQIGPVLADGGGTVLERFGRLFFGDDPAFIINVMQEGHDSRQIANPLAQGHPFAGRGRVFQVQMGDSGNGTLQATQ